VRVNRSKARVRDSNGPVTWETVRQLALALPGAEEGTSYGTPAYKVGGKLFARLHQDDVSLVIKVDFEEREILMEADPETFYITDHYLDYPWMLVRLSTVRLDQLRDLLRQSWRLAAPRKLLAGIHGLNEA
jgi:hypothetical protein